MKKNKMIMLLLLGVLLMALLVACNEAEEMVVELEEYVEVIEEEPEVEEVEEEPEPEVVEIEAEPEPEIEEEPEEEELEGVYALIVIGTWVMKDDETIIYTFETDGRGTRTTPGVSYGFDWVRVGDGDSVRLISDDVTGARGQEIWIASMDGDVLVAIKSTFDDERNGVEFRYIRVE
jgi:hypothetical protein